ncbi:SLC13 family permease [Fundicoccus culcitae]|uniref:Anion permease n=1 Tax=Fundicoccus culcitae TaxID=2969821 RepID=A0ABY5P7K3_9LACT|nr:SLC13 family permease [Fundicoccus culcitae]UUX34712.1 anion permease [Fundicoccus culcitae]
MTLNKKNIILSIISVLVGIAIAMVPAPAPMGETGMITLGILIAGVLLMLFNVLDEYVAFLFVVAFWAIFQVTDFGIIFSVFSSTTTWLLIGALGIGAAASSSGLMRRLALYLMRIFPTTFVGQSTALLVSGILIGPFIPSTTAKAAIVGPVARSVSEAMGYEPGSRGAGGIFASFYTGYISTAPAFLSASFASYAIVGLLPDDIAARYTWMGWFISALPWAIVFTILAYFSIILLYKPKNEVEISSDYVENELAEMGGWSFNEKLVATVLVVCLAFWMTETVHGIHASMIALIGCAIVLGAGVVTRKQFRSEIAWDQVVFIGCMLGIGYVFPAVGINDWIIATFGEMIVPLMSNHVLFLVVFMIFVLIIRFVIVSWTAAFTLLTVLLAPFVDAAGINLWIIPFVTFVISNTWFVKYNSSPYVVSLTAAGGDGVMVTHNQMVKYSVLHTIATMIAVLAAVPFWRMMGLLY